MLPVALMSALPFCIEILPQVSPRWAGIALAAIFTFRLVNIYNEHEPFTERVTYLNKVLDHTRQYNSTRFWIKEEGLKNLVGLYWALPYETLMLSSIPSPDSARTIELHSIVEGNEWMLISDTTFINCCWGWTTTTMPHHYFRLDTNDYVFISENLSNL